MYNSHTFRAAGSPGLRGLINLGNTCYINAVLQALSHAQLLDPLRELTESTNNQLINGLSELLQALWSPAGDGARLACVNPKRFKAALDRELSQFRGCDQHDAQELLVALIDLLVEARSSVTSPNAANTKCRDLGCWPGGGATHTTQTQPLLYCQREDINKEMVQERLSETRLWKEQWELYKRHLASPPMRRLFHGFGATRFQCTACGELNIKMEPVTAVISLPVLDLNNQKISSLARAVEEYFREELLEEDEAWLCPCCKVKQTARKTTYIYKWPHIVVAHLKRFSWSPKTGFQKLSHFVDVDRSSTGSFYVELPKWKEDIDVARWRRPRFELFAVINHMGSYSGGHYEAVCYHPPSCSWWNFGDSVVTRVDNASEVVTATNYLLFFRIVPRGQVCKGSSKSDTMPGSLSASPNVPKHKPAATGHHASKSGPVDYSSSRTPSFNEAKQTDSDARYHRKDATVQPFSPIVPPRYGYAQR